MSRTRRSFSASEARKTMRSTGSPAALLWKSAKRSEADSPAVTQNVIFQNNNSVRK